MEVRRGVVLRSGAEVVKALEVTGPDLGSVIARIDAEWARYPGTTSETLAPGDPTWVNHFADPNAPAPAQSLSRKFLKGGLLPNIDGATNAAKRTRLASLLSLDGGLNAFFALLNTYEVLTNADHVFARNLWAAKLASGGLTSGEVTAIQAAAPTYGITLP